MDVELPRLLGHPDDKQGDIVGRVAEVPHHRAKRRVDRDRLGAREEICEEIDALVDVVPSPFDESVGVHHKRPRPVQLHGRLVDVV